MGRAIVDTFAVFFGEEGTAKILDFYEDNYFDMMEDVFPYIQAILLPKLEAESAKRREAMIEIYRSSDGSPHSAPVVYHAGQWAPHQALCVL